MCNGANLSFNRAIFPEIQHIYEEKIQSGDDMFILQQLKKRYRSRIHFIKNHHCIVKTNLSESLFDFIKQRIRWSGKARYYTDPDIIICGAIVSLSNILLLITFVFGIVTSNCSLFFIMFIPKFVIDFFFLYRICTFYKEKSLILWYPIVQIFYFLYVSFTIGLSLFIKPTWKDR